MTAAADTKRENTLEEADSTRFVQTRYSLRASSRQQQQQQKQQQQQGRRRRPAATAKRKRAMEPPATPPSKSRKLQTLDGKTTEFRDLHDDLLLEIYSKLEPNELAAVSMTSQRFRKLADGTPSSPLWRRLLEARWGPTSRVTQRAVAALSGDWKALFGAKVVAERDAAPWYAPSSVEADAMVHIMCDAVHRGRCITATLEDGQDDQGRVRTAKPTERFVSPTSHHLHPGRGPRGLATPGGDTATATVTTAPDTTPPPPPPPLVPEVVFLIDGSGSVTNEDFDAMKSFVRRAGSVIIERNPAAKLGIVQFANFIQIGRELTCCPGLALGEPGTDAATKEQGHTEETATAATTTTATVATTAIAALREWTDAVDGLTRINGGTNLCQPLRHAQKMFAEVSEHLGDGAARVVGVTKALLAALLTDGRVDAFQASEAVNRAARMSDELDNFELYAFGVGRGVNAVELNRIVSAGAGVSGAADSPDHDAEESADLERYMPLRVIEDPDDW